MFGQSQICGGDLLGACVKFTEQDGKAGFTISPGFVEGLSFTNTAVYHRNLANLNIPFACD